MMLQSTKYVGLFPANHPNPAPTSTQACIGTPKQWLKYDRWILMNICDRCMNEIVDPFRSVESTLQVRNISNSPPGTQVATVAAIVDCGRSIGLTGAHFWTRSSRMTDAKAWSWSRHREIYFSATISHPNINFFSVFNSARWIDVDLWISIRIQSEYNFFMIGFHIKWWKIKYKLKYYSN